MRSAAEALALAVLAAGAGYAATYATKHYVPGLWLLWLGSAAVIAFALSWWRPRYWSLAALSTPSLVVLEAVWKLGDTPATAAALGLGFAVFWALTAWPGALFGRMVGRASA